MKFVDFATQVMNVSDPQRDALALKAMLDGHVPSWVGQPEYECTTEALIDGAYYQCRYRVMRNYLPIGEDGDNYKDWGVWPLTQKSIAAWCAAKGDRWYLPTKKIVANTWRESRCKINPQPISRVSKTNVAGHPGEGTETIVTENRMLFDAMAQKGCPWNTFTRGLKAYAVKPNLDGSMQYFGGWFWPGGQGFLTEDPGWRKGGIVSGGTFGDFIQGFNDTAHFSNYEDYSQGVDLVYYNVLVNGVAMDFADVCAHPKLHVLVSDQGPLVPKFPNKGLVGPATPAPMPPPLSTPPAFKGPEFKTQSNGNLALVKAGTFDETPITPAFIEEEAASSSSRSGLGVFVAALGVGLVASHLIKRAQPRAKAF